MKKDLKKVQLKAKIKNTLFKVLHIIGYVCIGIVLIGSIALGVGSCNNKNKQQNNIQHQTQQRLSFDNTNATLYKDIFDNIRYGKYVETFGYNFTFDIDYLTSQYDYLSRHFPVTLELTYYDNDVNYIAYWKEGNATYNVQKFVLKYDFSVNENISLIAEYVPSGQSTAYNHTAWVYDYVNKRLISNYVQQFVYSGLRNPRLRITSSPQSGIDDIIYYVTTGYTLNNYNYYNMIMNQNELFSYFWFNVLKLNTNVPNFVQFNWKRLFMDNGIIGLLDYNPLGSGVSELSYGFQCYLNGVYYKDINFVVGALYSGDQVYGSYVIGEDNSNLPITLNDTYYFLQKVYLSGVTNDVVTPTRYYDYTLVTCDVAKVLVNGSQIQRLNLESYKYLGSENPIVFYDYDKYPILGWSNLGSSTLFDLTNNGSYQYWNYTIYDTFNLFTFGFDSLKGLFSIMVVPGITLGVLLFMPLVVTIIIVVLKLLKK